jgi:hypothetical protein
MNGDSHRSSIGDDHIWPSLDQFFREVPYAIDVAASPSILDRNVPPICPPRFFKAMDKCRDQRSRRRIALRVSHQHADASHLLALLRPRRKRPSYRRATEKCDELRRSLPPPTPGQILTLVRQAGKTAPWLGVSNRWI